MPSHPPTPTGLLDVESLLSELCDASDRVSAGKPPLPGRLPRLGAPVAHVALQPADVVRSMKGQSDRGRMMALFQLAFQYGVCQGYAMKAGEVAEAERLAKLFADLEDRPDAG